MTEGSPQLFLTITREGSADREDEISGCTACEEWGCVDRKDGVYEYRQ